MDGVYRKYCTIIVLIHTQAYVCMYIYIPIWWDIDILKFGNTKKEVEFQIWKYRIQHKAPEFTGSKRTPPFPFLNMIIQEKNHFSKEAT